MMNDEGCSLKIFGRLLLISLLTWAFGGGWFAFTSWAADELTIEVEPAQVVLGEAAVLRIKLNGEGSPRDLTLDLPNGWTCQGRSQSSSMQIINGQVSRSVRVDCTFFPDQEGEFDLGPAGLNGQNVKSNTVKLKVIGMNGGINSNGNSSNNRIQSNGSNAGPHNPHNSNSGNAPAASGSNPPAKERPFAWQAQVSQSEVYYGTPLVYTLRFYHQKDKATPESLEPPTFTGFWFEKTLDAQIQQEVHEGKVWQVFVWQYLLIPEKDGTLTIPGPKISGSVVSGEQPDLRQMIFGSLDRFFGQGLGAMTRPFQLKANDVQVQVRALPPPPAGANFQGLVGNFTVEATLDRTSATQGDSLTYKVVLSGTGNFTDAKLTLPDNPAFKFYEDKGPVERAIKNGQLVGTKTFVWAVVPLKAGNLTLPAVKIDFFNPATQSYQSVTANAINLQVAPAAAGSNAVVHQDTAPRAATVEMVGEDLMPLKTTFTSAPGPGGKYFTGLMALYLLCLPLLRLGRERWSVVKKGRSYQCQQAWKAFIVQIKSIRGGNNFAAQLGLAWSTYLAVLFDRGAVTAYDLPQLAQTWPMSAQDINALVRLLEQLDAARFGGATIKAENQKAFLKQSISLATKLKKVAGKIE